MTTYVVSRHPGAVEWVQRRLRDTSGVQVLDHVADDHSFSAGDRVCGVLPLSVAARICEQGATPFVIDLTLPKAQRGRELSADELEALGARLVRYEVSAFTTADEQTPACQDLRPEGESVSQNKWSSSNR